jgi:hypothetical protein
MHLLAYWTILSIKFFLVSFTNKTFLALQEVLEKKKGNVNLIRGHGKAIAAGRFLTAVFQGPVYYWGDIDKDGYEIFACVRELFPRAISVLMDDLTLQKYTSLIQSLPQAEPSLSNLPADLRAVYERVCREGIRIEQEKIPLDQILAIL